MKLMARELLRWLCEFVASNINTSDANVKEVVLTALQLTMKSRHLRR
jgi:hypothetical protein